ncbi:MAG: alpha/beta hydrolase [Idiomarina sp.]|nr:alpha/beta hydrolase [Idiomarina sp.]
MKKLFLSLAVTSALGLTGCLSDGTKAPVTEDEINIAATRVVFDPGAGKVPIPSDILLSGTTDGTLNLPVADPSNFADPTAAIAALDGWSTAMPFEFEFDLAFDQEGNQIGINPGTVTGSGGIRVFKAIMGGDMNVPECTAVPQGATCQIVEELQQGVDFTVVFSASGNAQVVPLRPYAPKTGYVVGLTDNIRDDLGRAVQPSTTYYLLSKPLATQPIGGAQEQALQGLINSQRAALAAFGQNPDQFIFTNSFTTQSIDDVLQVVKQLMLQPSLAPRLTAAPAGVTAADLLQIPADPTNPTFLVASSANIYGGDVTLPYFSPVATEENPTAPLTGRWQATAVSPASILIGLQSGAVTQEELIETLVALGLDPSILGNPAALAGAIPYEAAPEALAQLDQYRHLTKFNPIPRPRAIMDVPLWMSVPNLATANAVRAAQGLDPLVEPADGWPVVIFQHGITGTKENFLAIAGTLAIFGHAAVAIDHPLHGERGFNEGVVINATSGVGSPTDYLNLASLLTARDNLRQSTSDLLGLRLSLSNGLADITGANINGNDVKFVGHSLGAMAGHNFVAVANTPLTGDAAPATPLYNVRAATLGMPGGGIAPFLIESQSFGPLIGGLLSFQSFEFFQAYALEQAANEGVAPGSSAFMARIPVWYVEFFSGGIASPAQMAQRDGLLAQFQFAAQTVVDSGDPVNYASLMVATETPTFLIQAQGDATIPNSTAHPLGGTEPLIRLLGLPGISGPTQSTDGSPISGAARYLAGGHAGLLDPSASAASTQDMQQAIGAYFQSNMLLLNVNEDLVQ